MNDVDGNTLWHFFSFAMKALFCSEDSHDLKQVICDLGKSAPKGLKSYKNTSSFFLVTE